jgi:hypothetical protein
MTSIAFRPMRFGMTSLLIVFSALALAGCGGGKSIDGVYHAASGGPITITLKSGKATVEIGGEAKTLDYKVNGNKLTIINPKEGDMTMTINDDGTLSSALGMLSKKSS